MTLTDSEAEAVTSSCRARTESACSITNTHWDKSGGLFWKKNSISANVHKNIILVIILYCSGKKTPFQQMCTKKHHITVNIILFWKKTPFQQMCTKKHHISVNIILFWKKTPFQQMCTKKHHISVNIILFWKKNSISAIVHKKTSY